MRSRLSSYGWRGVALVLIATSAAACSARESTGTSPSPTSGPTDRGAGDDRGVPAGIVDATLTVDGRDRIYRLVVPSAAEAGDALPLVLILHGNGTDASSFADKTGFDAVAEREGFLAVYPEADRQAGVWNGGFSQKAADIDDVAYLRAVVDHVAQDHPVDRDRVFATGLSGGGMMSYRLACEDPELVAAIAPVSATMVVDCSPDTSVSVLHIHGTEDRGIPLEGREDRGFPPVADVLARWADLDRCEGGPDATAQGAVTTNRWDGCEAGIAVEYLVIQGGEHEYPRADLGAAVDAPSVVWDFFVRHPRG